WAFWRRRQPPRKRLHSATHQALNWATLGTAMHDPRPSSRYARGAPMLLIGFLQAQNCSNLPASWRHPESRTDFLSADFYREIARVLELGKFHLAFFDDRLAMPDRFGNDHTHTVEHGIRCVKLDPIVVLMAMGMATTRLGLGATCSTTYYEPFHVARLF